MAPAAEMRQPSRQASCPCRPATGAAAKQRKNERAKSSEERGEVVSAGSFSARNKSAREKISYDVVEKFGTSRRNATLACPHRNIRNDSTAARTDSFVIERSFRRIGARNERSRQEFRSAMIA